MPTRTLSFLYAVSLVIQSLDSWGADRGTEPAGRRLNMCDGLYDSIQRSSCVRVMVDPRAGAVDRDETSVEELEALTRRGPAVG